MSILYIYIYIYIDSVKIQIYELQMLIFFINKPFHLVSLSLETSSEIISINV